MEETDEIIEMSADGVYRFQDNCSKSRGAEDMDESTHNEQELHEEELHNYCSSEESDDGYSADPFVKMWHGAAASASRATHGMMFHGF
jgi:hypothetical protein